MTPKQKPLSLTLNMTLRTISIAYFCLELALQNELPTYAGGLGILAGDTLKTAADIGLNYCGVSLLYREGYFKQSLDYNNCVQIEQPDTWEPRQFCQLMNNTFEMQIFQDKFKVQIWEYSIKSKSEVKVYLLDTNVAGNSDFAKSITQNLYCANNNLRLAQEILLGVGGMLALGFVSDKIPDKIHLNESAAAFLIPQLQLDTDMESAKKSLVFTTHTPEVHGHRQYEWSLLQSAFSPEIYNQLKLGYKHDDQLFNQTRYCLENSGFCNAVSKIHQSVSKQMFPGYPIESVTNGVHERWISPNRSRIYKQYLGDFETDKINFHKIKQIPNDIWVAAHYQDKQDLVQEIKQRTSFELDPKIFTIGFARRVDPYKRHGLLIDEFPKLEEFANQVGGLQIIYSGKAFVGTGGSNSGLNLLLQAIKNIPSASLLKVVYVPNYNLDLGLKLVNGVDLWLNNPIVGKEACGTSGMKANINGIPNLSTLDGWWSEGSVEGMTGFNIIGNSEIEEKSNLVAKLSYIINLCKSEPDQYLELTKNCALLNSPYFSSRRMLEEYLLKAYLK